MPTASSRSDDGGRFALVVGNSSYSDSRLAKLRTPEADVRGLSSVLSDPTIGKFDDVIVLVDSSETVVRRQIARFFANRLSSDLLLLYFSGHGILDENGHLYLAAFDTETDNLSATAIAASFISERIDNSFAKQQVLILDCCHSGAFARGAKGRSGASVGTANEFKGSGFGRYVLTASDSTQYAWEGESVSGAPGNSVFTRHIVEGLRSGEADTDGDGKITLDELYGYVYEKVLTSDFHQTPCKWTYGQRGDVILALSSLPVTPVPLPPVLINAIESPITASRDSALTELAKLLEGESKRIEVSARSALEQMLNDDSKKISARAASILSAYAASKSIEGEIVEPAESPDGRPYENGTRSQSSDVKRHALDVQGLAELPLGSSTAGDPGRPPRFADVDLHITANRLKADYDIYDTLTLIARSEQVLINEVGHLLGENEIKNIDAAKRCLAFALYTAASYHLIRAAAGPLHEYYTSVLNKAAVSTAADQLIDELKVCGKADKGVLQSLEPLREFYRSHSGYVERDIAVLGRTESITLFKVCLRAIAALLRQVAISRTTP